MVTTIYIAPAMTDQAGQCRIYAADGKISNAAQNYREHPDRWKEVGLMSSRGQLVCSEIPYHSLKDLEPLSAGLTEFFDDVDTGEVLV